MYRPKYYDEPDHEAIIAMIRAYPFATLFSARERLWATHLPLLPFDGTDGRRRLIGHLAKGNRQWRMLRDGDDVLAVFAGPHAYISPRWYPDEPDVPTWNYVAAHVYGRWRPIDDWDKTRTVLKDTVARFEQEFERPWTLDTLDSGITSALQRGVQAFEIVVARMEAAKKLGQDKSAEDVAGVVSGLGEAAGAEQKSVAVLMERANKRQEKG